jgi:hypothetical protein
MTEMAQRTFNGVYINIRVPLVSLSPNERRIWNLLKDSNRGWTEKQIHEKFPEIATVDNRLRDLRKHGWAFTQKSRRDNEQRWYALVPNREEKP